MQRNGGTIVSREIKKHSQNQQLTGDNSNSKQATTAAASRAQMQGQRQQHCGSCCLAACNGNRENFTERQQSTGGIAAILLRYDDRRNSKEADNNQWAMATESWCQWRWFLHQLLCEQRLNLVAQWGDGNQKEKWQCLQGWFVNNGNGEFGMLHHLNFSKGHYDMLVDA